VPTDGFERVKEAHGCTFAMRGEDHPDKAALQASCHWPAVDPSGMAEQMQRVPRYVDYVYPIEASTLVRDEGSRWLVYQRQHVWPIADREVLLWMTPHPLPSGGLHLAWTAADEEPLQLRPGAIRVPRNDGFWRVEAHAEGGTKVVHQIAMDGGGRIPKWVVDLVRTRGFVQVMGDVRELMRTDAPLGH
jgi:hypothetical protein